MSSVPTQGKSIDFTAEDANLPGRVVCDLEPYRLSREPERNAAFAFNARIAIPLMGHILLQIAVTPSIFDINSTARAGDVKPVESGPINPLVHNPLKQDAVSGRCSCGTEDAKTPIGTGQVAGIAHQGSESFGVDFSPL